MIGYNEKLVAQNDWTLTAAIRTLVVVSVNLRPLVGAKNHPVPNMIIQVDTMIGWVETDH